MNRSAQVALTLVLAGLGCKSSKAPQPDAAPAFAAETATEVAEEPTNARAVTPEQKSTVDAAAPERAELHKSLGGVAPVVTKCLREANYKPESSSPALEVRVLLMPDGRAVAVKFSGLESARACVASGVMALAFPKWEGKGAVEVTVPLSPSGELVMTDGGAR